MIGAVDGSQPVISGGIAVTGWKRGCDNPGIPEELRQRIWTAEAPQIGNRRVETRQMWVNGDKAQRAAQFPDGGLERMMILTRKNRPLPFLLLKSPDFRMPVNWK